MRALILSQSLSGDSFQKLHILTGESGLFVGLNRHSKKQNTQDQPIIFDTAEIEIQNKSGSSGRFINSYELIERRVSIGNSYRSLEAAAKFARFIIYNIIAVHSSESIYELAERSLNAFAAQKSPDHVYFKALYLLLKQEGYPVRESWFEGLSATTQADVADLLRNPAPTQDSNDLSCQQISEALSEWMEQYTDFKRPKSD